MSYLYDLIAISPHPDDAEIGCGGTLALLTKKGYRVGIIDLTDGEPTPFNENPEVRIQEANESARILGVDRFLLDLPNRELLDSIEARMKLARLFREIRPRIVVGMIGMTPGTSPDHYQSQLIFDSAIFYSRLSKWEKKFGGLKPWLIEQSFYYYTAREQVPTNLPFQFIVNISDFFAIKKKALLEYKSQFKAHPSYNPPIIDWIEGMGRYYGNLAGCKYGEVFFGNKIIQMNFFEHLLTK
ncbi:PIG-L family deacetylase [Candidatus Hodarchaeum mangrovi]